MPRRFQFVPLWNIAVFFIYAMRRVDCPQCGVTVERVPGGDGKDHLTTSHRWFLARGTISSGVVEGSNGKARLTTRTAFGFRTAQGIEIALFHVLGRLPEPAFTHGFC